jgi:hypothetical protein
MATVSIFMMIGMLSLAVDLGWGYFRRDAAQTAADAAASAVVQAAMASSASSQACGSNKVWCGSPAGTATNCPATAPGSASTSFDNGCILAYANGFVTSGNQTVTITANTTSPAPTVPGTAVTYWATVKIVENASSFFGSPIGGGLLNSTATATAAIESSGAIFNDCIYVLSTTASPALSINNGAHITTSSCGVYINSNSTSGNKALYVDGATLTSSTIDIVGGYTNPNGGSISSVPHTGMSAVADPFASLPSLTPAGTCNSGNFTAYQATAYTPTAGTYCNFNLSNGNSATMGPGIYIINGGTFNIQSGPLNGTAGVMVYLVNGATVSIANGATVNMTAQSTGTYAGILFYQDRGSAESSSDFAGGANMTFNGTMYMPKSDLTFDNGIHSATTVVVANTIDFAGGATFNGPTSESQTGLPTENTNAAVIQ